jgi:hypothetical protein
LSEPEEIKKSQRLNDKIEIHEKSALMERVKYHMGILIDSHLSEYLELKDNRYRATDKFKEHHKTLEFVASRLKEWAGPTTQTDLYKWAEGESQG